MFKLYFDILILIINYILSYYKGIKAFMNICAVIINLK